MNCWTFNRKCDIMRQNKEMLRMFDKYLDLYILKMESIKLIKETIESNIPNRINKELNKYQDAILMDFYFDQLLSGEADKNVENHVQKYITINEVNKEEKRISYRFNRKGDALNEFKSIEESRKAVSLSVYTLSTMYNNVLISILIEFENIVTSIFEDIITRYPDAYLNDTTVSYVKIIKANDIDEIKRKIISNEVDSIMRESIFKWLKIIEKKHKIIISLENQYTKDFIESYLRRNIIVHNDSKINMDYINGMKIIGEEVPENMVGKKLLCTKEYIEKTIDASIYFIIYIINQIIVLFNEENENFTNAIINLGFQKIKNEEYNLAREIQRLLKDNKTLDQQSRVYALINYWQTYKWDGKYEDVKKEIEAFDISAYEDLIKLAVYSLKDNYEKIETLLSYEFSDEKQNEELAVELEDFPVFKQLRKQKFYKDLKEKYPNAFNVKSTQIDEENEDGRKEIVKNNKGKFEITIDVQKEKITESEKSKNVEIEENKEG